MSNDILIKRNRYGVNLILNDKIPFPELVSQVGEKFKESEKFFGKTIYLETFVKVDKDWRNSDKELKNFGYNLD